MRSGRGEFTVTRKPRGLDILAWLNSLLLSRQEALSASTKHQKEVETSEFKDDLVKEGVSQDIEDISVGEAKGVSINAPKKKE